MTWILPKRPQLVGPVRTVNKSGAGLHETILKSASRIYGRAWRERNPGATTERVRAWREANPGRRREVEARWRERNRERLRAYHRAYYYRKRAA